MLSQQGIVGCRVIEAFEPNFLLPTRRVMAGLAARRQVTLMWIGVAPRALVERKPDVLDIGLHPADRRVALVAGHRDMRAGEWIF